MDTTSIQSDRRHDLDWLRFIAIVILLFFHTGMIFNQWGFHIKNSETDNSFGFWMVWLHFWRMPLLLFISGAGTYMAMGKRTPGQFAGERFKRLFIPLIFGMFVVVPPQIYFEYIRQYNGYLEFYKTVFDFQPYPGGSFSWHHLWFILYLFIYSLLALPLLKFLRSEKSARFKARLWKIFGSPAGIILIPAVTILLTQIALRPYFPEETHNLIQDWAFFTFYFCFFVMGMVCYSNVQVWQSIGANRKFLLVAAIVMLIPFYAAFCNFYGLISLPWSKDTVEMIFDVSAVLGSWCWVITIVAFGQHYLYRSHKWLSVVNEGLYPFYILHQTAIIAIGYYACQLDWGIAAKFWVISLLTLVSCVGFYLLLIRPFNAMRLLFGMKTKKKEESAVAVA